MSFTNDERATLKKYAALAASIFFHSVALAVLGTTAFDHEIKKARPATVVEFVGESAPTAGAAAEQTAEPVALPQKADVVVVKPIPVAEVPVQTAPKTAPHVAIIPIPKPQAVAKPKVATTLPVKKSATGEVVPRDNSPEAVAVVATSHEQEALENPAKVEPVTEEQTTNLEQPKEVTETEKPEEKPEPQVETPKEQIAVVAPVALPKEEPVESMKPQPALVKAQPKIQEDLKSGAVVVAAGETISAPQASENGDGADSESMEGVVTEAELGLPTRSVSPSYPMTDKMRHHEGDVVLRYSVAKDGGVSNVRVHRSSGSKEMDLSATKALAQYRYKGGRSAEVIKTFSYRLRGEARYLPSRLRSGS